MVQKNRFLRNEDEKLKDINGPMNMEQYDKILENSIEKIEIKTVRGNKAGDDEGDGAKEWLEYADFSESGWWMFGHCKFGDEMWVTKAKQHPLVKENDSWERVWDDHGSKKRLDYAVWIPTHSDSKFKALGVICMFRTERHYPEPKIKVAMVHESILEESSAQTHVWKDDGNRAKNDITLKKNMQLKTLWPTHLKWGNIPQCFSIKREYTHLLQ